MYNYDNYKGNEIKIFPRGLLNLSTTTRKIKKYNNHKDLNMYNSCYINASIQCLFRLDEFVKNILKCENKGNLVIETKNLIYNMQNTYDKKKQCTVAGIKQAMGEKDIIYNNDEQEDANEFITNYLNQLVEETKDIGRLNWRCLIKDEEYFNDFLNKFQKRKGNSFILDLFYGLTRTEEYCNNCNAIFSIKFNTFNILELPISEDDYEYENTETLDMKVLLQNFISEKKNKNERCSKCNKFVKVKTSINSLPKNLIIYFNTDNSSKKRNKINIQRTINFENYVYDKSLINDNEYFYHLKGIIFYSKFSTNGGHYKAACLVNNEKWYYFDDNRYETDHNLLRIYDNDNPSFLFYEK